MIDFLILALLVLALRQPSNNRKMAAMIFALICGAHNLLMSNLDGLMYYLSAGLCDWFIIVLICTYTKSCKFTDTLLDVSLISLSLNFYGWAIYEMYYPPGSYNVAFLILYFFAILVFLWGETHGHRTSKRHSRLRVFVGNGRSICCSTQEEAGP